MRVVRVGDRVEDSEQRDRDRLAEVERLGIYLADPGTPDYDAMILLDLTAPRRAGQPAAPQRP